jgi:hypothetical protein
MDQCPRFEGRHPPQPPLFKDFSRVEAGKPSRPAAALLHVRGMVCGARTKNLENNPMHSSPALAGKRDRLQTFDTSGKSLAKSNYRAIGKMPFSPAMCCP